MDAAREQGPDASQLPAAGQDAIDAASEQAPNASQLPAARQDVIEAASEQAPDASQLPAAGQDAIEAAGEQAPDASQLPAAGQDAMDAASEQASDASQLPAVVTELPGRITQELSQLAPDADAGGGPGGDADTGACSMGRSADQCGIRIAAGWLAVLDTDTRASPAVLAAHRSHRTSDIPARLAGAIT